MKNMILSALDKVYGVEKNFVSVGLVFTGLYIIALAFYAYYYNTRDGENNVYNRLIIIFLSVFPVFVFLQFRSPGIPNWLLNGMSFFCILFPWAIAAYSLNEDKLYPFASLTLFMAFIAGIVSEHVLKLKGKN